MRDVDHWVVVSPSPSICSRTRPVGRKIEWLTKLSRYFVCSLQTPKRETPSLSLYNLIPCQTTVARFFSAPDTPTTYQSLFSGPVSPKHNFFPPPLFYLPFFKPEVGNFVPFIPRFSCALVAASMDPVCLLLPKKTTVPFRQPVY